MSEIHHLVLQDNELKEMFKNLEEPKQDDPKAKGAKFFDFQSDDGDML